MDVRVNNKKILNNGQISDIAARHIIEKIFLNITAELNKKKINNLLPTVCFNHVKRELNKAVQQIFICREIDPISIKNNPQMYYDRCYIDNDPINECQVVQPKSTILDRWKIYQMPIVKMSHLNTNIIEEAPAGQEEVTKKKKTIRIRPFRKINLLKKKQEEEEINKKKKNQIIDLPSYPIEDLEKEQKIKNLIYKGDFKRISHILNYQQLNEYYLTKLALEEELKQKELNKKLNLINTINKIKQPKKIYEKYKGKNINVDHNGEIVLIKEIKIEDLQDDFLGLNSKLNEKNKKSISQKSLKNVNINVEKNKREEDKKNENNNYLDNKNKEEKGQIIAGSSFNNFYPEIGVNIKEGQQTKSGGNDFFKKYKKFDITKFNNTMANIYKESFYKSRNIINNNNNTSSDFNNASNNIINSSNLNGTSDNFNNNQSLYRTMFRSISLPDIKPIMKSKNLRNNSVIVGDNITSFIDSYQNQKEQKDNAEYKNLKYSNYIQASEAFKQVMLSRDNDIITDKKIKTSNSESFINTMYHKGISKINNYKKKNKYNDINDFNATILNDKNWGKDIIYNNSFNNSYFSKKNRFHSNNKFNSTIRQREKKKIIQNMNNYLNISNPKNNIDEKNYVLKYLNRSNDK